MNIPVLIPAYNPDKTLILLVHQLIQLNFKDIIIVNDGSKQECDEIFYILGEIKQCHILRHAVNLGKGRALKNGLNYFYLNFLNSFGIVTADADGQHNPDDIVKIAKSLENNPNKLVLGVRKFGKSTPWRSLIGNTITKYIFAFLVGQKLTDTQTGLRGIPIQYIPLFIRLEGERYEYEMNMLLTSKSHNICLIEEQINTIYIENNKSSYFNPLIDSMKIYFLFIRFLLSSLFASLIDFIIFTTVFIMSNNILTGIVFARLVSGNLNFFVNKNLVFRSSESISVAIVKYYTLFIAMGGIAYFSIHAMAGFGINVILAKIMTETLLFIASFTIQRDVIFTKQEEGYSIT
jgi:glycosyltransferase involved in cell wall biosynthesis